MCWDQLWTVLAIRGNGAVSERRCAALVAVLFNKGAVRAVSEQRQCRSDTAPLSQIAKAVHSWLALTHFKSVASRGLLLPPHTWGNQKCQEELGFNADPLTSQMTSLTTRPWLLGYNNWFQRPERCGLNSHFQRRRPGFQSQWHTNDSSRE